MTNVHAASDEMTMTHISGSANPYREGTSGTIRIRRLRNLDVAGQTGKGELAAH